MRSPRLAKAAWNAERAGALARSRSTSRWGALDWPPVAISIEPTPLAAAISRASSKACSVSESVYRPMSNRSSSGSATGWRRVVG